MDSLFHASSNLDVDSMIYVFEILLNGGGVIKSS